MTTIIEQIALNKNPETNPMVIRIMAWILENIKQEEFDYQYKEQEDFSPYLDHETLVLYTYANLIMDAAENLGIKTTFDMDSKFGKYIASKLDPKFNS